MMSENQIEIEVSKIYDSMLDNYLPIPTAFLIEREVLISTLKKAYRAGMETAYNHASKRVESL